jgi:CRISPR/Cas system-associated exonuclease Cas4 (RecB family)
MTTFIQDIAEAIRKDYAEWETLTVVFPNRRAALYFKKELTRNLSTPQWSPRIITIEELINSFSSLHEADKLTLILKLYQSYKKVTGLTESIDRFYYWGEMLLRDFDELDKYLIDPELLFRDVSNLKEVDQYFDYLTEEQKEFLKDFWDSVEFSSPESKSRFLELWRSLFPVYQQFQKDLLQEGIAYAGMIHRSVALDTAQLKLKSTDSPIVFAGFNALTGAEEKIISWFVENRKARVFWDEDEFYVNSDYREAGTFFRQYRNHSVLGKTFTEKPASYLSRARTISITGVPQKAGQPKLLAQQLAEVNNLQSDESRVIVLPDESLLMPLLYSLPSTLTSVNVTMGYPLVSTPYFSLIDFLFDLHRNKRKEEFYYKNILALLNHPYLKAMAGEEVFSLRVEIEKNNWVHLPEDHFANRSGIVSAIFKMITEKEFIPYLIEVITLVATSSANGLLEKEFGFHFHRMLTKLQELIATEAMELLMLQRLFRQIARAEKVPFSGEPLKGIQIMGILETRNLDFYNVHVLSLNEGNWPAAAKQGSYLPHSIRRAYGLPTYQHQDAMYAYLFYRLLQRAEHVDFYYNTIPDVLGSGEMSRYLYQLMYETGWKYEKKVLYSPIAIQESASISIPKDTSLKRKLEQYKDKALTPSSINTYIECRLKFYFKSIVGLKEVKEVEEEADARIFGNIFHDVMQFFYTDSKIGNKKWEIEEYHFENLEAKLDKLIERAYRKHFGLTEKNRVEYTGQQLVVNEMVKKMASEVLNLDRTYAPFHIEMLEQENFDTSFAINSKISVLMGGKIDRVDKKEETIRIIDYKTGRDSNSFESIESLFARDDKNRNKAAFQAILYSWIYQRKNSETKMKIQPGLINRTEVFKEDFRYGLSTNKEILTDITPYLMEFEDHLSKLLNEIFLSDQPFDQTTEKKLCEFCSYKEICNR